jgi:hypothetical protein
MSEYINHYFSAGAWYQNIFIYGLLAGLVYANIFLIKAGEKKKVGVGVRRGE